MRLKTLAETSSQKTFASPEAAGEALFEAAKAGDQNALLAVFGPEGKDLYRQAILSKIKTR